MSVLPLRLPVGSDLRRALEKAVAGTPQSAGFVVSGIGSLSEASLRFAGADAPTVLHGPLEILSLAGTVTADGAHLHATVSTASGSVHGGHVAYGCRVRTTAEILLAPTPEWRLSREPDPATGHDELVVEPREAGAAGRT